MSEASTQILWTLHSSKACGTSRISVSSAHSVEATSGFSCFMLEEGDWNQGPNSNQPSRVAEEGSIWLQPEVVLDQRERHLCQRTIKEVLVQWKDMTPVDATKEPATILQ